jgi:hypothetical protein
MKNIFLLCVFSLPVAFVLGQKQTYDLVSYTAPKGYKKEVNKSMTFYTVSDAEKKTWCRISIVKSTISKGSIDADFESEWQELAVRNYDPSAPVPGEVAEAEGWKIKSGLGKFVFDKKDAVVMVTTFSGYNRCISIVAVTNSNAYMKDIDNLLGSLDLKKPKENSDKKLPTKESVTDMPVSKSNNKSAYTFTTTNFDDGWTGIAREDWVEVTKGNIRVLIHYPNKAADAYNSVIMDGLKNAWNILVAPKYSSMAGFEAKPVSSYQPIEFAEADVTERSTGKTLHVVLFKMNYTNGNGRYLEFITPNKNVFEQEFGAYHETSYGWEKMEKMANYNKFAVAAADLPGKWSSDFSGAIQYVNAVTGFDAGMDTHASNESYVLAKNKTYSWDLGVATGPVGRVKFQSLKAKGSYEMDGNWKIHFSDIEGKQRHYDIYFSCIKGLRILWIDNKPYAKVD